MCKLVKRKKAHRTNQFFSDERVKHFISAGSLVFMFSLLQSELQHADQQHSSFNIKNAHAVYIPSPRPPLNMHCLLDAHDLPESPDEAKWKWVQRSYDRGRRNHPHYNHSLTLLCHWPAEHFHPLSAREGSGLRFNPKSNFMYRPLTSFSLKAQQIVHWWFILSWTKPSFINIGSNCCCLKKNHWSSVQLLTNSPISFLMNSKNTRWLNLKKFCLQLNKSTPPQKRKSSQMRSSDIECFAQLIDYKKLVGLIIISTGYNLIKQEGLRITTGTH